MYAIKLRRLMFKNTNSSLYAMSAMRLFIAFLGNRIVIAKDYNDLQYTVIKLTEDYKKKGEYKYILKR